jgi:hypothetical protein
VPISPVKVRPVPVVEEGEEGHAEDADATVWENNDTVEEAVADVLAKLDVPKPKEKQKPVKDKQKPAKKDESIRIEGLPESEEPKVDPDDDNALGDFLRGIQ